MNTSIIICTYNEEQTIFNVVAASCKHNPDAEVIVVDDGSTDNTEEVLETLSYHYDFVYLKLPENHGKSYAMAYGVEYSSGEIILFFNADVTDVRHEHFSALLEPMYSGKADLIVGSPSELTVDFNLNPYKSLLGQKAMLKEDLIPVLNDIREIRYGVETYILLHYQTLGKRIHFVSLDGLRNPDIEQVNGDVNPFENEAKNKVEIANALLTNIDLITKRLQNNLQKTQNYTKLTITSVQVDLNKRMKKLKDRTHKVELVSV